MNSETTTRMFPVLRDHLGNEYDRLGCPRAVPWSVLAPHEEWAHRNHGQSLETLASRGGLGIQEIAAIVTGVSLRRAPSVQDSAAIVRDLVVGCLRAQVSRPTPARIESLRALAAMRGAAGINWPIDEDPQAVARELLVEIDALDTSPRIASLLTSVARLRDELDAERARSERMARVINVADMMRSAPVDERRDRWDVEYDAARAKVESR